MNSVRAQISQIMLEGTTKAIVYQRLMRFIKGSQRALCTDIKGLKEF
jgi:hypothetical protein